MNTKMIKYITIALSLLIVSCTEPDHEFNPARLTIVIPYGLSGASAKAANAVKDQLSVALGETVYIESVSGDGGQLGASAFWNSERNDRLMFVTSAKTIPQWGMPLLDVEIFPIWTDYAILSVSADSDIKTFKDLTTQDNPVQILTEGKGSSGYLGLKAMSLAIPEFEYDMRTRKSGAQAAIDVAAGNGHAVLQLFSEQRRLIEDGDLIPLAVIDDLPFKYKGLKIPPLTDFVDAKVSASKSTFALMIAKDNSPEFIKSIRDVWSTINVDADALKQGTVSVVREPYPYTLISRELKADERVDP